MSLPVLDLDHDAVVEATRALARRIVADDLQPRVVLAVLNGGAEPARLLMSELKASGMAPDLLEVVMSRPGVSGRKRLKTQAARFLPRVALNALRRVEHRRQVRRAVRVSVQGEHSPDASTMKALKEIADKVRAFPRAQLLLVDDAVDSGSTMRTLLLVAESYGIPRDSIKTVALVATTAVAEQLTDYFHFCRVLCRFPWSVDAR